MKTNMLMQVRIGDYVQPIHHLTKMGRLNDLWAYGNELRRMKGLTELDINSFLRSRDVIEFIKELELKLSGGRNAITLKKRNKGYKLNKLELTCLTTVSGGRQGNQGTWAHLYIMLKAAAYLDKSFELALYEEFIKGRILEWRDEGGNRYNELHKLCSRKVRGDTDRYMQELAIKLRGAIGVGRHDDWNKQPKDVQEKRAKLEEKLIMYLEDDMLEWSGIDKWLVINCKRFSSGLFS